ncbi:conserved hypothetical protein [uncultured Thiomicrorhabdus sp.]
MKLKNITLVNWSLYEPIDIPVEGSVAFVGENGAGKSSLLDAIQIVLFGGNQRKISLNSQTSVKNKGEDRTIKAYCQGVFRPVPNNTEDYGKYRKRDDTYSYIALSFEHPERGFTNIIVGIEARASDKNVSFPLLCIMNASKSISRYDFMEYTSGEAYRTYSPKEVFDRLEIYKNNAKEIVNLESAKRSSEFVELVARALSPQSLGHRIDHNRLETVLKKSVELKSLGNVSSFVRNFILNPSDLDTTQIQSQKKHYAELEAEIEGITQQIEKLGSQASEAKRVIRLCSKSVSYNWISLEKLNDELTGTEALIIEEIDKKQRELTTKSKNLINARNQAKAIFGQIEQLNIAIGKDDAEQRVRDLEQLNEFHKRDKQAFTGAETDLVKILRKVKSYDYDVLNLAVAKSSASGIQTALSDLDKRVSADPHIAVLMSHIDEIKSRLEEVKSDSYYKQREHKKSFEHYQGLITTASPLSPIKPKTRALVHLLEKEGIEAVPVCHLAQITNAEWQPAIEALIGGDSEALIVSLEDEENAFKVYRQALRENLASSGVKIVKSSRTASLKLGELNGTAAEFVESDNVLALKFLQYRLQRYKRVQSEAQLKAERFALTQDGMLSNDLFVTGLELRAERKFTQDSEANMAEWKRLAKFANEQRQHYKETLDSVQNIAVTITLLENAAESDMPLSFSELQSGAQSFQDKIDANVTLIEGIDLDYVNGLKTQRDLFRQQKEPFDELIEQLPGQIGRLEGEVESKDNELKEIQAELEDLSDRQNKITEDFFFDAEFNDEIQEQLEDTAYEEVAAEAHKLHTHSAEAFVRFQGNFNSLLAQAEQNGDYYPAFWEFELNDKRQLVELRSLIIQQKESFETDDLARYQKSASNVNNEIKLIFRRDIVANLQGKFQEMREQISMINSMLKNKVLHNHRYELKYKTDSAYKNLVSYIRKSSKEDLEATDDLFDQIPDDVMDTIETIIETGDGSDYRTYFNYEFVLTNLSSGEQDNLSDKLSSGSGGEKQSPLYIALSAALSAAWRCDSHTDGAALALFDEAFKDLDFNNLQSAIGFMGDVGLQTIYAAPDEKEGSFRDAGINTIIYLTKDDDVIDVDVDTGKEKAANLVKQNPLANRELMDRLVNSELERLNESA